jgi:hypothetical protein
MGLNGSFPRTKTSGLYEWGMWVHLDGHKGLEYRRRARGGHADADVDGLRVVHTSGGMYRRGGMPGCTIGQKAVRERVYEWSAYSPLAAGGTMMLIYPLG